MLAVVQPGFDLPLRHGLHAGNVRQGGKRVEHLLWLGTGGYQINVANRGCCTTQRAGIRRFGERRRCCRKRRHKLPCERQHLAQQKTIGRFGMRGQPLENTAFQLGAESFQAADPAIAGGILQRCNVGNAQLAIQAQRRLGPDPGHAHNLQHAVRHLHAQPLTKIKLAGGQQLGDFGRDRRPDPGNIV